MMKYSLSRIAEELGVSKATVSQVLNGKGMGKYRLFENYVSRKKA